MFKHFVPLTVVLVSLASVETARSDGEEVLLSRAVKDFNEKAKKDTIGKDQSALTEDEVVAAIRGWIRTRHPASDAVYGAYQKIAATGVLPPGAGLSFTTGWQGFNGFDFEVWWIDLQVPNERGLGYVFRIRDRKISSRPTKR